MNGLNLFTVSLLSIFFTFAQAPRAIAGPANGGGGNAIQCDDGKIYAWDYVNSKLDSMAVDPVLLKAKSADQILKIMAQRLVRIHHGMAASLEDFRQFNTDPLTDGSRVWLHTKNALINLNDEDRSVLPESCIQNAKPNFKLFQAVIRQTTDGGKIRYNVDDSLIKKLNANSPLQLSVLYIHEWLRDFNEDPSNILLVNQLLHSQKFWTMSQEKFLSTMKEYGMSITEDENFYPDTLRPGNYEWKEGDGPLESFTLKNERDGGHLLNAVGRTFYVKFLMTRNVGRWAFQDTPRGEGVTVSNLRAKENKSDTLKCYGSNGGSKSCTIETFEGDVAAVANKAPRTTTIYLDIFEAEGKPNCVNVRADSRYVDDYRTETEVGLYCKK